MPASAHDVAAAIRERLSGVGIKKLHKLLYYCQGHHLAQFGEPLFFEDISAWDMGPVVVKLWQDVKYDSPPEEIHPLDEGQLNTVGYVVSRYGGISGEDLEHMTHGEHPWRVANADRLPHGSSPISHASIRDYFLSKPGPDDDDAPLDSDEVRRMLEGAEARRSQPLRPDSIESLRARLTRA
jgi:uncharacterized phage-associated protein